ncbi:MAG: kelch repeat-containing protein [Candidatus Acidiferrales bacterium]
MTRLLSFSVCISALTLLIGLVGCGGQGGAGNPGAMPPAIIATSEPPDGMVGNSYAAFAFNATGGVPPLAWSESGALPAGMALSGAGVLSGTPTGSGSFLFTVMVQDRNGQSAPPQEFTIRIAQPGQSTGFTQTGSMVAARHEHTAVLLESGKVLVAGGSDDKGNPLATAEIFDEGTGMFTGTGSMLSARSQQTATRLMDGRILITGGVGASGKAVTSAEVFDSTSGMFTAAGNMDAARTQHTATLLENGEVLICGGLDANGNPLMSAEIFDPVTGSFHSTGNMLSPRALHTATLLHVPKSPADGEVLVAGGYDIASGNQNLLATAELFDPASGTFAQAGSMQTMRAGHAAVQLNDGRVLITGGKSDSSELFNPSSSSFTSTGKMSAERSQHTATKLNDGRVLIAGGATFVLASVCGNNCITSVPISQATTELYDPTTGMFVDEGDMVQARFGHTATLLNDARLLVTGGVMSRVLGRQLISTTLAGAELLE